MDNQPIQTPPTPTKWWPINWRHNKFLKIIDIIYFLGAVFILLFLLIFMLFLGGTIETEHPEYILKYVPFFYKASMVLLTYSGLVFLLTLIKYKTLDIFEKFFLLSPFFSLLMWFFLFFVVSIKPSCCASPL